MVICTLLAFAIYPAMDTTCLSFYIVKLIPLAFISQQEKHLYSLEITKLLFTERTWCPPIGLDRMFFELIMCSIVQRTMPLVETPFCVSFFKATIKLFFSYGNIS